MGFTKKEIDLYERIGSKEFRKKKTKEELEKIEDLLSGEELSVLSLVQTPNGKYSEKMAWNLIEELTECLQMYLNKIFVYDFYQNGHMKEEYIEKELEKTKLKGEAKEFYQSFLYLSVCVVDFLTSNIDNLFFREEETTWAFEKGKEFCTIINLARNVEECGYNYRDYYHLCGREINTSEDEILEGIFLLLDEIYLAMKGKYDGCTGYLGLPAFTEENDLISKEDMQSAWEYYKERLPEKFKEWEECETMKAEWIEQYGENYQEVLDEMYGSWEELSEEDLKEEKKISEYVSECIKNINRWGEAFPNKDSFIEQYKIFRKGYFSARLMNSGKFVSSNFSKYITGMINVYLSEKGCDFYTEDDEFFSIYTKLKKIEKLLVRMSRGEE